MAKIPILGPLLGFHYGTDTGGEYQLNKSLRSHSQRTSGEIMVLQTPNLPLVGVCPKLWSPSLPQDVHFICMNMKDGE